MTESMSAQPESARGGPAQPPTAAVPPAAAVPPPAPTPDRARGARWVNIALAVAIAVAIGGLGFAAGRMTAPTSFVGTTGSGRFFGDGNVPGGPFPSGFQAGGDGARSFLGAGVASIEGTVESISGDTLTLKLANGQTVQVSLDDATTYHSQAAASSSDVTAGATVIVRIGLGRGQGAGVSSSASDVTIVP